MRCPTDTATNCDAGHAQTAAREHRDSLRSLGLPAQSGPVHVAFDNAGRPLRAELTVPGVLWNTLTEPGHGSAKNVLERRSGGDLVRHVVLAV